MNKYAAQLEALLYVAGGEVQKSRLQHQLDVTNDEFSDAVNALGHARSGDSGLHLIETEAGLKLVTNPAYAELIETGKKDDDESSLTKPQLETLTIIAYRGPITKPELEHIRGVNSSMILRNLLMRGMVDETESADHLHTVYTISADMLQHLGLGSAKELPDYDRLHEETSLSDMVKSG
ncbi:MAG: SMC-Scp complex subunit ScpB [bacterium]|nr:SMC-Scp complex subunit ScpB [bacterium]